MKSVKTKSKTIKFDWLPPVEEWDFRSVTKRECRVASHWEYAREDNRWMPRSAKPFKYYPRTYRQAARELFPQAWTTLSSKQREQVLESFLPLPVVQVRKLGDFLQRVTIRGTTSEIPEPYLERSYVIVPNFTCYGVEAVIKELQSWARKEAKEHPQARRAQAAELPFDALKWLAVMRIDEARRKAKLTIGQARNTLEAYVNKHPHDHHGDIFPSYGSDGAWSKARSDALKCQARSEDDPSYLLAELA